MLLIVNGIYMLMNYEDHLFFLPMKKKNSTETEKKITQRCTLRNKYSKIIVN